MKPSYTAPMIEIVGSLSDLTLRNKEFGTPNDGDFLHNESLTTIS